MLWLIYHKTTSGDKHRHDLFVWCCASEEKEVHPFGGARSTARRRKWRRRREGRGGGLASVAEHVGAKFSQLK